MNQLTHQPITQNTALSAALQSPRAIEAKPKQLEMILAKAMAKAFADSGVNAAQRADDIKYLVQNMPSEVVFNLPNIRLNEIAVAINRGVLRQFGDYYGLNVATFMRFLTAHYQSEQRLNAVKAQQSAAVQVPIKPPETEMQQILLRRVATAFEQYKSTSHYNDYGSLVFNTINGMGKIPFGTEREAEIWKQAKQNLINRYSRVSMYPDERHSMRATLNSIVHGEAQNLIVIEAKRLTLFELFDMLISDGVEVLEFLGCKL